MQRRRDHHVGGLQVAVHDPRLVGARDGLEHRAQQREDLPRRARPCFGRAERGVERRALDPLEHRVRVRASFHRRDADVVDSHDRRVMQPGDGERLGLECLDEARSRGALVHLGHREDLHRHRAAQREVRAAVHRAVAPARDEGVEGEAPVQRGAAQSLDRVVCHDRTRILIVAAISPMGDFTAMTTVGSLGPR